MRVDTNCFNYKIISVAIVLFLLSSLININVADASEKSLRKIIVFKNNISNKEFKDSFIKKYKGTKIKDLDIINGTTVLITQNDLNALIEDVNILRVEDDSIVYSMGKAASKPSDIPQPFETIPWGISKIEADKVHTNTTADNIKVAIIDTGIDLNHPDIKSNIKGGFNAISSKTSYADDNGHGTHVAGTIAALHNSIGVVGVAPNVDIYIIKALNSQASGYISDIIEGIDWSINNKMQVINMSFGLNNDSQSLHDAIVRANIAGIVQVAAAGNNSGNVLFPAVYPEVISVSAIDGNLNFAPVSSFGKVDLAAPGININSTYLNSSYTSMNGTSMAAAHVTGTVALLLSVPSKCDLNGDGICLPQEVQKRLEDTAIDLGNYGKDNKYGAGLVDAYKAVLN